MNDYRVQRHSSLLYLLMVLLLALPGWAQDEDEDPAMTGECIPAELTVPYDTLSLEGNSEQQIAIWYDYAREYFKKAKYENKEDQYHQSIPYFWMVALSDKSGRFRVVYSRLAEAYSALNEIDSTLIVVYRGLKKYPDYSVLHYHAGQIHRVRGNLECAIPHYQALLADVGTDAQAQKRYLEILARCASKLIRRI